MNQSDLQSNTTDLTSVVTPEQLTGWLPVDAVIDHGAPAIEWMDLQDVQFSEPFFNETLARVNASRTRQSVVTSLDLLLQFGRISDSLSPTGFIFHTSRCGSTLLANACRALNDSIVIAEAPVVDKIATRFLTDAEPNSGKELLYMLFLKAAVTALGQRRSGLEQHYFVKLACVTTLQMTRIRRVWPDVPFVFLYRNPIEVIVSNLRNIPEWMKPDSNPATAAAIAGINLSELSNLAPEEFCARALGRFLDEASANRNSQTRLIDYDQLTPEVLVEAIRFFGIEPSNPEVDAIHQVSRLYSKDLTQRQAFQSDGESKRDSASSSVRQLAEKWALPSYERLNSSN